jgi:hypothetical protein
MINKLISSLFISVFVVKHLSQAITMVMIGFKLPYLAFIALITFIFNIKYIFKKITITKKQLYVFILTTIFYLLIINNLNYDYDIFIEKSDGLLKNGFIYLFISFMIILLKELPDEEYFKKIIKFFIVLFLVYAIYKVYLFNEEYPLNSIWIFSYFHSYFSFFKMPSEIIEIDALRVESIRSGRLAGIFLLYAILFTNFSKIIKLLFFFSLLLLMILIGNRGSVVVVLFILFIFINKKYILGLTLILIYIILALTLKYDILMIINDTIFSGKFQGLGSSERLITWQTALYNIDTVGFFGNGIGGFYELIVPGKGHVDYPHNIGLEIFYELGYIAFFIYLFTIYLLIKKAFIYDQLIFIEKFLYISSIYYILVAQLSGNMYMNINSFSFIIMFFLIHYNRKRPI